MIRLAVRVHRAAAEVALAELLELAPAGVEEVDLGDVVEYAVYGAPGELPALPDLRAAAGGALVEVTTSEVADDWDRRWQRFHRPIAVPAPGPGRPGLVVRPPWAEPAAGADALDLVIDPGQAFGTGGHATTRLCLELIVGLPPGGSFVDLGCGSGVLAIAAARLGWGPVRAVDHDPASLEATGANARANGVDVRVERVDLRRSPAPAARTAAANLTTPLLLAVAERLEERPERLVASGLLEADADAVAGAFAARGLVERDRRAEAGWAALLLG